MLAMYEVQATFVGEAQLAGRPLEQLCMEFSLELHEPGARRGGREAELSAGSRETALACRFNEEANITEIVHDRVTRK